MIKVTFYVDEDNITGVWDKVSKLPYVYEDIQNPIVYPLTVELVEEGEKVEVVQ